MSAAAKIKAYMASDRSGSIYLEGCTGITALPDGLTVGGSLDLKGCTGITALPDGLTVGGYLYLKGCTGITALPDGLTVGGYLDLQGCTGITALPDGLTVGGYLDIQGCTGLEHYAILQHRGYTAYFINGRIYARFRNFSLDQAREHWAKDSVVIAALDKVADKAGAR